MLLNLSLHNFVLVEQLHLDFQSGFTVLTGETGAGKSVTLDALGLLLGDKADFSQIRHGAKEAQLSALFDLSELDELKHELRHQGLLADDAEELALRRIIDAKGKSRSFINNQAATLAQLKQIGQHLIDIHGQNAHHSLNHEAAQRQLLDAFAGHSDLLKETQQHYQNWQQAQYALYDAQHQTENLIIERERLQWQFNELEQLGIYQGEWESLSHSHDTLAHAAELLHAANAILEWTDGDNGMRHLLAQCQKNLLPLKDIEPRFAESLEMLASVEAELSEVSSNMGDVAIQVELNPAELAAQEERMRELMAMARKYRVQPEELPIKYNEIQTTLHNLEAAADIATLEQAVAETETAYMKSAKRLSAQRHQAAAQLSQETTDHMQHLAMKGAKFHIELLPASPSAHGLEQVQYQVAVNKGSQLRPLNKVASGGELARISLALQVVTSSYTRVPTLIFDEVDTGIGGGTAETVGRALRTLGKYHQVLAVTHLPQVAAYGEHHWQVSKHNRKEQTYSQIQVLDPTTRIAEIARMLGGEHITETTHRHAAEMLAMAINGSDNTPDII